MEEFTDKHFDTLDKIFLIGESILASLAFFFNFTVIYLFTTSKSKIRRKLSNYHFFIQAITDLIVTLALALSAATKHAPEDVSNEFTTVWVFFLEYSQFLSINTLFIISFDRFLSLRYPLVHRTNVTISKCVTVATINFIISTIPALVSVTYILQRQFAISSLRDEIELEKDIQMKYQITMGSFTLLMVPIIFVLLVMAYQTVKSSIKRRILLHHHTMIQCSSRVQCEKKKEKKIIKILFSMCLVYTVTYFPFSLVRIFYRSVIEHLVPHFVGEVLIRTSALIYYSTACTDPLTTLFFKDDYANALCYYQNCMKKVFRIYSPRTSFSSGKSLETNL